MAPTVVIGAGVSGIAAAIELDKAGADVLVLEHSDGPGGVMRSHREGGFLFEDGPTSALDSDGALRTLCRDLGIEQEIVESRPDARARYLYHDGVLRSVPSKPAELLSSPLLTVLERVRFLREAFIAPAQEGVEESVYAFVERRFGRGIATKFAAAIVSGIYAGDPARLSVDAAFPEIRAIERQHGSLLGGLKARAEKRRAEGGKALGLLTLAGGLGRIGPAFGARLGTRLRTGARVLSVERASGSPMRLTVDAAGSREHVDAEAVILATSARAAAALPGALPAPVAATLNAIGHASLAVVQAGFRKEDLPGLPPGFGFLVPREAGLESLGWIFLSQVFDGRAPEGCVALSGFFGGMIARRGFDLGDGDLGELALRELGIALGMAAPPRAEILRIVRWRDTLPQYELGHQKRIAEAIAHLDRENPRIALAGNYLTGISIPSCIVRGRAAAAMVLKSQAGARP